MQVLLRERALKGYAMAKEARKRLGTMTYIINGAGDIVIEHTIITKGLNTKNIGPQLLQLIIDMARKYRRMIIPECSYARALMLKNKDWHDVLKLTSL